MNRRRLKQVMQAAATLPPAQARALMEGVSAKAAPKTNAEERIVEAALLMEEAMLAAAFDALTERGEA